MNGQEFSESRIRIVHCIGTMRLGGAEKQLAELIARLPASRFDQSLVLVQGGGPLLTRIRQANCEVFELNYIQKFCKYDLRCYLVLGRILLKYIRYLRRRRPHILHAQLYWANILSVLAGRLAGVPVIITSRLQLSHYKKNRPILQILEDFTNCWTTAVFANSESVRKDVMATERINPGKIRIFYNGVVLDDFKVWDLEELRQEFGLGTDTLVIVAVANLHAYKGHDDLLRATAILKERNPKIKLLIAGRDQGMRAALESLIESLNLNGIAYLMGERMDIPRIFSVADIVVHPSHEEGFSNSILEGMAAGKPMVVTNVGGSPEAVIDGLNGFVVPPRDVKQLTVAIDFLIQDPILRRRMGSESRKRIEQAFSIEKLISEFSDWYISLVRTARLKGNRDCSLDHG